MKQIKLVKIGTFTKSHGIHGQLALNLDDDISFDLLDKGLIEKEAVFVELDGIPVPFFIEQNGIRNLNSKTTLLKLEGINDQKAKKLYPKRVFLNVFYIDIDETKDSNHPKSWIGYSVIDLSYGNIGIVDDYIDMKENPLLSICTDKNSELLIPLMANFIIDVNHNKRVLKAELPEGYIESLS